MSILSRVALFAFLAMAWPALAIQETATGKIDINKAPLEELVKIIHIGESRAREIISSRPFSSLDDLTKISGIGEARLKDIKEEGLAWAPQGGEQTAPLQTELPQQPLQETSSPQNPLIIDVNTASIENLTRIIHIGEARATELISLRPFYSLDDLTRVKGISEKGVEDIKDQELAWIDPRLEQTRPKEISDSPEENLAAISETIKAIGKPRVSPAILITAFLVALSSGVAVLALKRNSVS